jgi:hypothetical protein
VAMGWQTRQTRARDRYQCSQPATSRTERQAVRRPGPAGWAGRGCRCRASATRALTSTWLAGCSRDVLGLVVASRSQSAAVGPASPEWPGDPQTCTAPGGRFDVETAAQKLRSFTHPGQPR